MEPEKGGGEEGGEVEGEDKVWPELGFSRYVHNMEQKDKKKKKDNAEFKRDLPGQLERQMREVRCECRWAKVVERLWSKYIK